MHDVLQIKWVQGQVLLDTGAQVSIMSKRDLTRRFGNIEVYRTEELIDSGVDLELSTENGTFVCLFSICFEWACQDF